MRIDDLLPNAWKAYGLFSWLNCYDALMNNTGDFDDTNLTRRTSARRFMVHVFDDLIERQRLLVGHPGDWYEYNGEFLGKHLRNIFRLNRDT